MKLETHTRYKLIILLILLNLIIRIPSVPHEIGLDSFGVHILANSISEFGYAKWWINSLSIFGMYPYSYSSSVPFILSGISQIAGINIEIVIWIFSVIIGIFSVFTAYLLAKEIWDNDIYSFVVAYGYSLSPGILVFSTWDATTRGLFIVILPLLIFLILKLRINSKKYILPGFLLFILLMATHHLFYFIIPILLSLIFLEALYKLKLDRFFIVSKTYMNILIFIGLLIIFTIPFFTGFFIKGSKYIMINYIIENNLRYTGFLILFGISGLIYLIFKNGKNFGEYFLLMTMSSLAIFLWQLTYMHNFITIFFILISCYTLTNMFIAKKNKYTAIAVVLCLLLSVGFSAFYQHWRTSGKILYMDEQEYNNALWIKNNIESDERFVGNENMQSKRIFAISGVPTFLEDEDTSMYIYGFADINKTPIKQNSPFSTNFYMDNPYTIESNYTLVGWYRNSLQNQRIESKAGKSIVQMFGLSYVIQNKYSRQNEFIGSLKSEKNNIYDNGKLAVWTLKI